jgi:predicted PurR-regulated permease PerM
MHWLGRIRRTHLALQVVVATAAVLAIGVLLRALLSALAPVVVAVVLAFAMAPLVNQLERLRLGRIPAIVGAFVITVAALAGFLYWLIPSVIREVGRFEVHLPASLAELRAKLDPLLARFGTRLPASVGELTDKIGSSLQLVARAALSALGGVASGVLAVGSSLVNILLVPLFTFYLLKDGHVLTRYLASLVPPRHRLYVDTLATDINTTLGGFIRGQLTVMLVLSVLYSFALSLVGIDLAVVIGVLTGLLSFIPYIGLGIGVALALLMAALSAKGLGAVLGVLVAYGVVAIADAMVITPKIVGGKVGLSPPAVIIALLLFGALFGFVGVLVAVPGAAVIKIVFGRLDTAYRQSTFYLRNDPLAEQREIEAAEREARARREAQEAATAAAGAPIERRDAV